MSMKRFFYKKGDFQPPYMYMFIFVGMTLAAFILASLGIIQESFATTCVTVFSATFSALVGLYNWNTKNTLQAQTGKETQE